MKHLALLLGLPLCAAMLMAAAPSPETPVSIAADLQANPPADLDRFYAIKTQLGYDGLKAVEVQLGELQRQETAGDTRVYGCVTPQWLELDRAGLKLARAATSDAEWKTSRDQITTAIADRNRLRDRVMAGQKVDPVYDNSAVPPAVRAATYPVGSRALELAVRIADDQFQRIGVIVLQNRSLWAANLSPAAWAYMSNYNGVEMCRVDLANTAWLKADVAAHGWPKQSVDGQATVHDAWGLVQHADHDIAFQRQVLVLMEPLLATKEVSGLEYAYLHDRVAHNSGGQSRFGTQGGCNDQGKWEPDPLEDPANLDARRASVGLGPEASYAARFKCPAAK